LIFGVGLFGFLALFAAIYLVTFAIYLGFGTTMTLLLRRYPERRIQPHRRGEKRMWKEIRQSAWSLVATSLCLAVGLTLQWKGWTLVEPLPLSWWSAPLMFVVAMIVFDTWFYWGHRAMHMKALYPFHQFHHRSVAPTVWSNDSFTFVDAFVMQSFYIWAPIFLPIPPLLLVGHRVFDHFNGMIGHLGHEFAASKLTRAPSPMVCTVYHDIHHELFRYNFANFFTFWDRVGGTLHPDYDRLVDRWEETGGNPKLAAAGATGASAMPGATAAPGQPAASGAGSAPTARAETAA
jgi:sterol desaturase/sphingolipid hydroxylase (fatty acid hydroxylase superfamily)